jgi:hypothetical protein
MKMLKRIRYTSIFLTIMLNAGIVHPHTAKLHSMKKLYSLVSRGGRPYAVALLYNASEQRYCESRSYNSLLHVFGSISSAWLYKTADLQFYKVGLSQEEAEETIEDLGITYLPALILFKFGSPVNDESGVVMQLSGFVNSDQMRQFIDDALGDSLQERAEQKQEDRERRAAQAAYYWYNYPYCYPYWGACGGGWGCGWRGGGCGWGCGPRLGIGIGCCL